MSLRIYSFEMTYVNYWKFNLCLDLSLRPITALLQQNFRSRQRETAHQQKTSILARYSVNEISKRSI